MFHGQRRPDRNLTILAASVFGLALGEELWLAYLPAYLSALGAGGLVVGLFGSARDLLDSAYQYPGGWLADRCGRRRALVILTTVAMAGYAVYAAAPGWPLMFVGLAGVMAWKAGAFPTTFAVIGDALPPGRRATAFSVQSVLVRVPRVIGAPIGGLLIGSLGVIAGVRRTLLATLRWRWASWRSSAAVSRGGRTSGTTDADGLRAIAAALPSGLKRLLVADCLVRIGEGVATSFIVLVRPGDPSRVGGGIRRALRRAAGGVDRLLSARRTHRDSHLTNPRRWPHHIVGHHIPRPFFDRLPLPLRTFAALDRTYPARSPRTAPILLGRADLKPTIGPVTGSASVR
jgi:MFS family permease